MVLTGGNLLFYRRLDEFNDLLSIVSFLASPSVFSDLQRGTCPTHKPLSPILILSVRQTDEDKYLLFFTPPHKNSQRVHLQRP